VVGGGSIGDAVGFSVGALDGTTKIGFEADIADSHNIFYGLLSRNTSPAQITANQNNYALADGTSFRISTDASRDITGIVAIGDGHMIILQNVGSFNFVIKDQDGNSAGANQFLLSTGADITIVPKGSITLLYDGTTQKWRDIAVR